MSGGWGPSAGPHRRADPDRGRIGDRTAGLAGDGHRSDRHQSGSRAGGGRGRTVDHPRSSRDIARRRPRDGQGGRDPDVARRPREPRRRRRARLGDPRGGRRGGHRGGRRRGHHRQPDPEGRRRYHHRRRHRRGVRGSDRREGRDRVAGADAAVLGRGARDGHRRWWRGGGWRTDDPTRHESPGRAGRLPARHRAQGLRAGAGRRRCGPLEAGGRPADRRWAGRGRPRRVRRRRLPPDRGWHDAYRLSARRRAGRVGDRRRAGRPRRIPRARRADEGHRDRLAAPRPGRPAAERSLGRRVRPGRARPARRAPFRRRRVADAARGGLPGLAGYRVRLGRAAEAAKAGDGRFVASPRVDSYHGIWFELHEDLIQLAGRTRADEVAAGRA